MWIVVRLLLLLSLAQPVIAAERVTVFAAASLTEVLEDLAVTYERKTGTAVRFSFAASSTLARQVEAGAPADIIALASREWANYLMDRGLIAAESRIEPIGNRLALVAPSEQSTAQPDPLSPDALLAALGPDGRIAMGDPSHVPAGIYARQALENLGLWQVLQSRLAFADDVRAALVLVARGEAPLGVVYASDVTTAAGVMVLALLPEDSHDPIAYPFAAAADGDIEAAEAFLAFIAGPEGRAAFARHGFTAR